jgi:hypothetical protein
MLYMIVESFKNHDAIPVYRRFREKGRLTPEGLTYVSSWITSDFAQCYQVVECDDPKLLDQWVAQWSDIVDFEIVPVITSQEATVQIAPRL